MIKDKKVVVTGGAGFIGSNLAEELANKNEVIIIDNFSTGKRENVPNDVKLIDNSVTNLPLLKRIFNNADLIFHQAALPSVSRSIRDPISANDANVNGTLNTLIAADAAGVSKVIYASSSSIYGDSPTLPKKEGMDPNPLSPYAITKLAGEYYCKIFNDVYELPTVSLRYFNVYGPRQDPLSEYAAVIPKFINKALKRESPTIYGDGEQSRDFTFIRDVVRANILAAESDGANGKIINIAGGKRITINELADKIIAMVGEEIEPEHTSPRPGDIRHSLADISKAKEILGYEPKWDLDEGLRITIDWFKRKKEENQK